MKKQETNSTINFEKLADKAGWCYLFTDVTLFNRCIRIRGN